MKKMYKVLITETLQKTVLVEASSRRHTSGLPMPGRMQNTSWTRNLSKV